ncbi:MAG: hypothetical protein WC467_01760 [Patescibacteria group bacterium]
MKKKYFNIFAIVTVISFSLSPLLALAQTTSSVDTMLTRDSSGGANPIVKAKWEMNSTKGTDQKYLGTDAATTAGAQFMPSGQYQVGKTITVCGIVTDPDGVADIDNVYSDVFYPVDISTGPNHEPNRLGCGQQLPEFTLTKLSKADGIELFCNKIKNNNNNLPTFNEGYGYSEICALDGELWKETAYAFCGEITLSYEDPSGSYNTQVLAQDKSGKDGMLTNTFTYLPLTAFEADFNSVAYGNVRLNTHKIISGDLNYSPNDGRATVRNIGNTRLSMKVWQNDMGLSQTDGQWNVKYDGRVGSSAEFANYWPETTKTLTESLNLSQTNEMDFSVTITKFPPNHDGDNYVGNMVLSATPVAHLTCAI